MFLSDVNSLEESLFRISHRNRSSTVGRMISKYFSIWNVIRRVHAIQFGVSILFRNIESVRGIELHVNQTTFGLFID